MNSAPAIPMCQSSATNAKRLKLPVGYNYIGVFLTFRCPYHCSFCINRFNPGNNLGYRHLPGQEWIAFFEKLNQGDVPITFQGGEPGSHPDFIEIIARLSQTHIVDILSNLTFDLEEFIRRVRPADLNRPAPYAPIRVSYHPEQFTLQSILERAEVLTGAGFRVGIYGVTHPAQVEEINEAQRICSDRGLDFRTKPFLGRYNGRLYGQYSLPEACNGKRAYNCECSPTELLLAPNGGIHRCHYYLYRNIPALDNISNPTPYFIDDYLPCPYFGFCNPCDVKIKNNRFQQFGHIAARIRNITPIPPKDAGTH